MEDGIEVSIEESVVVFTTLVNKIIIIKGIS